MTLDHGIRVRTLSSAPNPSDIALYIWKQAYMIRGSFLSIDNDPCAVLQE